MPTYLNSLNFPTLIFALAFLAGCSTSSVQTGNAQQMDSLVTVEWLSEHLNDPDLVVLDCTVLVKRLEDGTFGNVNGRASYDSGHIPSAGFADLLGELAEDDSPFSMTMPSPEQFSAAMGALGVSNSSTVVLYTSSYPVFPARVWWMLRWAGFDRAALLDGGFDAWTEKGLPVSTEPAERPVTQFTVSLRPELIADRDEVFGAIENNEVSLIDAMPDAHYQGQFSLYSRPGHIPSATSMPSFDLLDETFHYRSQDELEMMHDGDRSARVITYCGGGVAASSVAFAMTRLGYSDVAVYMGSLEEWTLDPQNPMTLESH
jgi:thiosulfate/3-mercaptopyruvate sulfurtransferase